LTLALSSSDALSQSGVVGRWEAQKGLGVFVLFCRDCLVIWKGAGGLLFGLFFGKFENCGAWRSEV